MARLDHRGLPISTTSDRAAERYREGVELLLSAWPTLLVALMRSDETAKARAPLDSRLHRRPSPRDTRWANQPADSSTVGKLDDTRGIASWRAQARHSRLADEDPVGQTAPEC